jgi:hypothetical protein
MSFKIRAIQQTNKVLFDWIQIRETLFRIIRFFSCRAGAQSAGSHGSAGSGQGVQAGGNFNEIFRNKMLICIIGGSFFRLQNYNTGFLFISLLRKCSARHWE